MRKLIAAICVLAAMLGGADEGRRVWYVDRNSGWDGEGRGSKDNPVSSIQYAIDRAPAYGLVVVAPGTYYANLVITNRPVHVMSLKGAASTIIDGAVLGQVAYIGGNAGGSSITGFTLQYGRGHSCADGSYDGNRCGGAVHCAASCSISKCIFKENYAYWGGAVFVAGGGVKVKLSDSLLFDNEAECGGGGVFVGGFAYDYSYGDPTSELSISRCTIADNKGSTWIDGSAGGIEVAYGAMLDVDESIVYGNGAVQLGGEDSADVVLSYCCLEDGTSGLTFYSFTEFDVSSDNPIFVNVYGDDYSLGEWSPCRTAGYDNGPIGWDVARMVMFVEGDPDDYLWEETGDGVVINWASENVTGDVVLPSMLDGKLVVGIASTNSSHSVFEDAMGITSLEISYGVMEIGYEACRGCSNLTSVVIPSTVRVMGDSAFSYCDSLSSINIPEGVEEVDGSFENCRSLEDIKVSSTVKLLYIANCPLARFSVDANNPYFSCDLDGGLFDKNKTRLIRAPGGDMWRTYTLPQTLEIIGDDAFRYLDTGRYGMYVTIPASVTNIGNYAFAFCRGVRATVADGNSVYASGTGHGDGWRNAIYNKDMTELLIAHSGGDMASLKTPASVTNVAPGAMSACYDLRMVEFSDSVKLLGAWACANCFDLEEVVVGNGVEKLHNTFIQCPKLKKVMLGNNIKYVYDGVFAYCPLLTEVVFPASVEEIGGCVFVDDTSLTNVVFMGNNPMMKGWESSVFYRVNPNCVIQVSRRSTGWDVPIPGTFCGLKIDYWDKAFEDCTATVNGGPFVYTGSEIKPKVTVMDGETPLKLGTDYTVSYEDNVVAGTATVVIEGVDKYVGTIRKTFEIGPKELQDDNVWLLLPPEGYVFDGSPKEPDTGCGDGEPSAITESDYTVEYLDNVYAGTATAVFTGTRNYFGTVRKTWTISKGVFNPGGAGGEPGGAGGDPGEGGGAGGGAEPGEGEVPEGGLSKFDASYVYDGKGHTLDTAALAAAFGAAMPGESAFEYAAADETGKPLPAWGEAPEFTAAGEYVVWYRVRNPNYEDFEHAARVTVAPKPVESAMFTLDCDTFIFDGTAKTPAVAAKDGEPSIISESDYTVAYAHNIGVGAATATVTGRGNYTGTADLAFEITSAWGTDLPIGGGVMNFAGVYDGEGHGISVILNEPRPAGARVRYARSVEGPYLDEAPLFTNVCHETVWYLVTADNFEPFTSSATVNISAKSLQSSHLQASGLREDEAGNVVPALFFEDEWPCEITADDWELVSWSPRASGGGFAQVRGRGNYAGTLKIEVGNEMTVLFDAVYGESRAGLRTYVTQVPGEPYVLPLEPRMRGLRFLGWFTAREGGEEVTAATTARLSDADTLYAHWGTEGYAVTFDPGPGACAACAGGMEVEWGGRYGRLPKPTRPGYSFGGWYESPDFAGDTLVRDGDAAPAGDVKLYAKWDRRRLWYSEYAFNLSASETYQGYLLDADESVAGTLDVKVSKPNKRGMSKVSVKLQIAGGAKETLKGNTFDGTFQGTTKDGRRLDLRIGANGLSGDFAGYEIDGARNVFKSKGADAKLAAAQALRQWQGAYVLAVATENGYAGVSLEVGKKGAVKVKGSLPDGKRLSGKAQLMAGERECAIAFSYTKKGSSLAFLVWLCEDGTVECSNLSNPNWQVLSASAKAGPYLKAGSTFRVDGAALAAKIGQPVFAELAPDGLPVGMSGEKFAVVKAGKVKLLKDKSGVDETKLGENPSGLKLSYTIRNCTFKGSFSLYAPGAGKLKKYKASVTGVVLEGVGYGMATIKGVGSFPVTIE